MDRGRGRPQRGFGFGDNTKRRADEGWDDFRGYQGGDRKWEEDEARREANLRNNLNRDRGFNQGGGFRNSREEDQEAKRRAPDQRGQNAGFGQNRQGNTNISVHDRIGGPMKERLYKEREGGGRDRVMDSSRNHSKQKEDVCFWCRQDGHHQADCTNPPFCFRCKESGHLAAGCPQSKGCSMHLYGYGFPGQGFYCLKIPGQQKQQSAEHVGLLQIQKGEATAERVEEELKHLIDNRWKWKVKQLSKNEYLAIFPNKQILDTLSRSNGVNLALHNITALVSVSNLEPTASAILQSGWVQIFNIPPRAHVVEAVTLIAELAGEVLAVDEVSLIREGPVRVRIRGRDVNNLRGIIQVFIDGIGYDIRFVAESTKATATKGAPPPPKKPDEDSEDEEDDMTDSDWEKTRTDRRHKKHRKQNEDNSGKSQDKDDSKGCQDLMSIPTEGGTTSVEVTDAMPITMHDPVSNTFSEVINPKAIESGGKKYPTPPADHLLVHTEGGGYRFLPKDKWPKMVVEEAPISSSKDSNNEAGSTLLFSQESMGVEDEEMRGGEDTEEQEGADYQGGDNSDYGGDNWERNKTGERTMSKKRFYPTVATRKSTRGAVASTTFNNLGGAEMESATKKR